MNAFEEVFSERSIVRQLCKARVKLAKRRHEKAFLHNIRKDLIAAHQVHNPTNTTVPLNIFPPRRQWHRFRPRLPQRGGRSSSTLNLSTLFRATLALKGLNPHADWAKNLNAVVTEIQTRALANGDFRFSKPTIFPKEKNPTKHEYRALVLFNWQDKIIDCLVARYLRESFDASLLPSCLAFRCRKGEKSAPTIHTALEEILRIRKSSPKQRLYVAECDIKGFFDCVSHKLVIDALRKLVRQARRQNQDFSIDDRAVMVLKAYLRAYSYSRDIYHNRAIKQQLRDHDPKGQYKWPYGSLRELYGKKRIADVGIPQGGALSCLIANIVLHQADCAVQACERKYKGLLYLRYCDDMIIIGRTKESCGHAFKRYRTVLKTSLLPIHPPEIVKGYSTKELRRSLWDHKSNSPYAWARPLRSAVPWIQFVGYQIRYDGLIRVRPKSLKKEFKKISKAASEMLRAIHPSQKANIRKNRRQIRHRFRTRLISMAVGRRALGPSLEGPLQMCWAFGFQGLRGKEFVEHPLKRLDRHRERQIRRVDRALAALSLPKGEPMQKSKAHPYYGFPFSYWGQFQGST